MFVRPVTFVDYFEIAEVKTEFSANLCLYDIDKDGDIELIIGNWDTGDLQNYGEADVENRNGELNVIKYGNVWKKVTIDGMVSSITAGEVINNKQPHIIIFCSNCLCYFYNIISDKLEGGIDIEDSEDSQLNMCYKQTFAPNAKNAVIEDIDNDGINEVFVGFTDRIVRMYKWVCRDEHGRGSLEELIKWELCSQIGRVAFHCSPKHGTQALVSQAGGSYAILLWKKETEQDEEKIVPYIEYKPMNDECKDNLNVEIRSEIIGNVRRCNLSAKPSPRGLQQDDIISGQSPYLAVCTIDGQVMLLDDNDKIWQVHLDRSELFGLSKVDITNNDVEEVVISSWEGVTYIINHHKEIVRFHPKHQCQAFISGSFAVAPGVNQPVLIYSTFENSLMIYYNLNLKRIPARSLLHDISLPLKNKIADHGIDVTDERQMQIFINDILYKWPGSNNSKDTLDFFDSDTQMVNSPLTKLKQFRSEAFLN